MGVQTTETGVFVARQPIFDRTQNVFGYELLFRSGLEDYYQGLDGDASTLDVVANAFLDIGLDDLTGRKKGFINFTRNLLLKGVVELLPKELVIVEILEDIQPDAEVVAACERLKAAGYLLALDDFVLSASRSPLLALADIIKVDFLQSKPADRRALGKHLAARGIHPLAEKVETVEVFQEALACGYQYFQGYFFSKPLVQAGKRISGSKLNYLQLVAQVNRPELSYDDLEAIIKRDVSLTYRLLQFINSAWFGLRYKISSIKHALVWLGPKEIRKWVALVALRQAGTDKPGELLFRCIARARMAESLADAIGMRKDRYDLFLMGMFSLIDAILDMSMKDALAKLPLSDPVRSALVGEPCTYGSVLGAITAYEAGQWEAFSRCAADLRLPEHRFPKIFSDSLKWAEQALGSVMG